MATVLKELVGLNVLLLLHVCTNQKTPTFNSNQLLSYVLVAVCFWCCIFQS